MLELSRQTDILSETGDVYKGGYRKTKDKTNPTSGNCDTSINRVPDIT